MLNKDKILKVEVLDSKGRTIVSTHTPEFQKDYFAVTGNEFVILKSPNIIPIGKGEKVDAVFYFQNGTRVKYATVIDLATDMQVNIHIGSEYTVLEERRRYFKAETNIIGKISAYSREEKDVPLEEPLYVRIKNINLGGVLIVSNFAFEMGDVFMLTILKNPVNISTEVLRIQKDVNGNVTGYGCRFINLTLINEELLARFIFECQILEREKRKRLRNK